RSPAQATPTSPRSGQDPESRRAAIQLRRNIGIVEVDDVTGGDDDPAESRTARSRKAHSLEVRPHDNDPVMRLDAPVRSQGVASSFLPFATILSRSRL